jgi:LacI family transcriptional regulator
VKKKAVIADVADASGVSSATVSRVLNTPEIVTPEVRERVWRALRSLDYLPHGAARALRSRRTRSVGVVVPTLGLSIFARGVEALQSRLAELGYRLLVANSQYDLEKEALEIQALLEQGIDGLVLVGNEHLPEARSLVRRYDIPVVITFVHEAAEDLPAVGFNNLASAYEMTAYLVGIGHSQFGVITSPVAANDRIRARRDGIFRCLRDNGLSLDPASLVEVPYLVEAGREALRRVMSAAPQTTAVLCTTDVLAIGAVAEAKRLGIDVPGRLSVAGFDNLEFASYLDPALTTVTIPAEEIGRTAADRLLDVFAGKQPPQATEIPALLAIRASTAPPYQSPSSKPGETHFRYPGRT